MSNRRQDGSEWGSTYTSTMMGVRVRESAKGCTVPLSSQISVAVGCVFLEHIGDTRHCTVVLPGLLRGLVQASRCDSWPLKILSVRYMNGVVGSVRQSQRGHECNFLEVISVGYSARREAADVVSVSRPAVMSNSECGIKGIRERRCSH